MDAESMAGNLAEKIPCEARPDGLWLDLSVAQTLKMAQLMREAEARLVTMTATLAEESGSYVLMYHWDLEGRLLTIRMHVSDRAHSIIDLWPGADWVEREIHDYYAIEFEGRDETPPLMLRRGDRPGLFSNTKDIGRRADPAYTCKTGEEVR